MDFWNELSPRLKVFLTSIFAAALLVFGIFFYPDYLKKQTAASQAVPLPDAPAQITVYVTGAVKGPGVYTLPYGSRIQDALKLAGAKKDWDPEGINLARRLEDEDMIVVPRLSRESKSPKNPKNSQKGSPSPAGKKLKPKETVSLNRATQAQFQELPGVGPGMAKRIADYRLTHGGFQSVEELKGVPGIGEKKFDKIKPYLRL